MAMSDSESSEEAFKINNYNENVEHDSSDSNSEVLEKNGETDQEEEKMSTSQPLPRRKRFIPKYDVDGVYKVILGEETQIQIDMVIGTHINAQYPWKAVSKEKILETIDIGGELSELFPLKELLHKYTEELVLIGYIVDESTDVDEFYVCCTTEARDHCKQQSDRFIKRQENKKKYNTITILKHFIHLESNKGVTFQKLKGGNSVSYPTSKRLRNLSYKSG